MDRETLLCATAEFSENSPTNYLQPPLPADATQPELAENFARNNLQGGKGSSADLDAAKEPQYVGMRFFLPPLIGIAAADDAGFETLKSPGVVGPHHRSPREWLPEARVVLTMFLPFTDRVITSNTSDPVQPSMEWLFARADGQIHLMAMAAMVCDMLTAAGYRVVTPQTDARYHLKASVAQADAPIPMYSSNWSERHVAVLAGIGTFGLSTNIISHRGTCGRIVSVITDWETTPDGRASEDIYGFCSRCRACFRACPAGALGEDGSDKKDIGRCAEFIGSICRKFAPRYGCGKCLSGIPCQTSPCL